MMKEKIKNVKGISLISLTVTIIVLVILTNIIIYNVKDNLQVGKLKEMQNDIANLRDKVASYYAQNGKIPASIKYTNIDNIKSAGVISDAADTGDFLVIDLSALENLTLNYGKDFKNGLTEENVNDYTDLYIINEASHNIFYVDGITVDNDTFYTDYTSEDVDTVLVNLRYVENVKIPDGFYYVGGTKDTGIVISDVQGDDLANTKQGNQFVWVAVENIDDFHTIEGYYGGTLDSMLSDCLEPYEDGYETEVVEYNRMKASVESNHGFYIGRYETGKVNNEVVVQKNVSVYNNIGWSNSDDMTNEIGGAVELAKKFAINKGYTSVTSTLCYGVQWDATMQFFDSNYINGICDSTSYVVDSEDKGNYSGNLIQTGSNDNYSVKNIYDMAGNVWEWTMESYDTCRRVCRGGNYSSYSSYGPASVRVRDLFPSSSGDTIGFRIALYLNEEEKWSPTYDKEGIYKDKNGNIAYIPEGFQVSEKLGENTIDEGLVVKASDGSEFVWVPVDSSLRAAGVYGKEMATKTSGVDSNGRDNYQGKLYNFTGTGEATNSAEMTESYGQNTISYREPSLVTGSSLDTYAAMESLAGTSYDADSSYYNTILGYTSSTGAIDFGKDMQKDYNAMIESVINYGGFYIGRYETSLSAGVVASKGNAKPMSGATDSCNTWYGMYRKQKDYANNLTSEKVKSSMIWGSQYDAMLNWALTGNDKEKVNATTNGNHSDDNVVNTGTTITDKINNIYDLEGNLREWTLEAVNTDGRVGRGGNCNNSDSPSSRGNSSNPNSPNTFYGSRLTLYIQ